MRGHTKKSFKFSVKAKFTTCRLSASAEGYIYPAKPAAISGGEAAAIGLDSFALGSALGSTANPYNPYYYPPGYAYPAPPPAYYPATPYYPPRRCWDP